MSQLIPSLGNVLRQMRLSGPNVDPGHQTFQDNFSEKTSKGYQNLQREKVLKGGVGTLSLSLSLYGKERESQRGITIMGISWH